jgi:NADH-quinone oxidoreductase subunit M
MGDQFLNTLLQNAAFLVVLMPLVGALLVACSASLGAEAARRTAQANALVTASLAVTMAVHLANVSAVERDGGGVVSRNVHWLGAVERVVTVEVPESNVGDAEANAQLVGPDVRARFSVDGINVWFVVLLTVAMFPVLRSGPGDDGGGAGFYVLLLVHEACLLGTFLAADVALFAFCAEASLVPAYLMIGGWGGFERRTAALRWFLFQGAAGAAIVAGLVLLVLAARWSGPDGAAAAISFSIPDVAFRLATSNHEFWRAVEPWAFGVLLVGFLVRSAVVPLHTWFVPVALESPPATALLLTTSGVPVGLYGLLRFVVPVFPQACAFFSGALVSWGVLGFLFASLLVLAQGNLGKFVACATLAHTAACLAGIFSIDPTGLTGAVLLAVHHGAAVGLLVYVVGRLNERFETSDVEAFGGLARNFPRLALLFGLAVLAVAGCPLGSGFVASLLVVKGVFGVSGGLALWYLVGTLLLAWSMLWNLQRLLQGRQRMPLVRRPQDAEPRGGAFDSGQPRTDLPTDLGWGETLAALPLVVIVLWLGIWPRTFVDVTEIAVRRAMLPYGRFESAAVDRDATERSRLAATRRGALRVDSEATSDVGEVHARAPLRVAAKRALAHAGGEAR